jgi:hypothetical protein
LRKANDQRKIAPASLAAMVEDIICRLKVVGVRDAAEIVIGTVFELVA